MENDSSGVKSEEKDELELALIIYLLRKRRGGEGILEDSGCNYC